jgi:diguanylate cyclase (GGDEF)-like protein/PAS domain S-box-containing protein
MKSGISDFIVNNNKIQLIAIVEREFHRNKFIRQCNSNLERYKEIIDTSSDAIIALDSDWQIHLFSKGAERLFGYSQNEAIGKPYSSLISATKPKEKSLNSTPADTNEFNLARRRDITVRCKDGSTLACEMNMSRSRVKGDQNTYTVILRDISDRKAKEEELIRLANYDALTNIYNRYSFYKALHREIKEADRDNVKFALLYIDLDSFKEINDEMGHIAGDQLLREFAGRLKDGLREIDTVARMGGDEFITILHNINTDDNANQVAGKITQLTTEPFLINDQEVTIGTSIGISIYPDDSDDPEKLISFADSALYRAKSEGRNRTMLYRDVTDSE